VKRVCILPGDGIGPEVIGEAVRLLEAMKLPLELSDPYPIGFGAYEAHGAPLPDETLAAVADADAALFGAVTTPPNIPNYSSPILGLRQGLTLFANVRPCKSFPHTSSRPGIDMVIVRENTEGLYARRERVEDGGDTAITERIITRAATERIVRYACDLAVRQGRKRVTLVHKANVLRESDGLFRRVGFEVTAGYPQLEVDELLVDACAMHLIRKPEPFDVIVTTNLFGDILSDEACMLVGGLGLACSANVGESAAVFEPVHGSAPDIAGTGAANPLATFLSAALMLEHFELNDAAQALRTAVKRVLERDQTPADLGGSLGTVAVTDAVLAALD
jgi:homoisocitrate dehydrogenase